MVTQHKCSELASWRRVVQTYWKHWTELHPAVGLVELPQGDVAIVRAGHMLTLLQQADPLFGSQHGDAVSPADTESEAEQADLKLLQQCVELLRQLLGQDVVQLFVHLWTEPPADVSLQSIGCAFSQVLSTGPQLGDSPDQPQAASTRDALRQWRQQRSAAILKLGQLISQMSQGTPIAALRDYLSQIAPAASPGAAASAQRDPNLTPSTGHALTVMLRQTGTQQLQSASYMLLLAWLDNLRAAGALPITPAVSNALKQEIAPQLQAHIRSTSITLWLCTAPAAALPDDEAARLKHSDLNSKLASLDFVSGGKQQVSRQQSLAELFLPEFAAQHGGGTPLCECVVDHLHSLPLRLVFCVPCLLACCAFYTPVPGVPASTAILSVTAHGADVPSHKLQTDVTCATGAWRIGVKHLELYI